MGDRATLERIFAIMRRLLLVPMDGANPIPRKGTTRHECYRALYEIQELLDTRGHSGKHFPQTNADRLRAMTDEELAKWMANNTDCYYCKARKDERCENLTATPCDSVWLDWLRQEAESCTK